MATHLMLLVHYAILHTSENTENTINCCQMKGHRKSCHFSCKKNKTKNTSKDLNGFCL